MQYNPGHHHRRSIRLSGYDYSQNGAYFVTICTHGRECLFGEIIDDEMYLNDAGKMIREWWLRLPERFPVIELDEFIIMPNHIHGIIQIAGDSYTKNDVANVGAPLVGARNDISNTPTGINRATTNTTRATTRVAPTIGGIVGAFKSLTANEYICRVKSGEFPSFETSVWQRNYYEHIIRNEAALRNIREYIDSNPRSWQDDENFG